MRPPANPHGPTAIFTPDDAQIWWRGGDRADYYIMFHSTAVALLPRLTGCLADLAPDLSRAIKEYERVHTRADQAA